MLLCEEADTGAKDLVMMWLRTRYAKSVFLLSLLLAGCSPHLFFEDGIDPKIQKTQNYRTVNVGCRDLSLTSNQLSVQDLRGLVRCLGSEGRLLGVGEFLLSLSDEELEPFALFLNETLFTQPQRLYEIEHTYLALESKSLINPLIEDLAQLLKHEQFVVQGLGLLRSAVQEDHVDPDLLNALAVLGEALSAEGMAKGMEAVAALLGHPAVEDFRERVRGTWNVDEVHSGARALFQWLDFNPQLLERVADGSVFRLLKTLKQEKQVLGLEVLFRRLVQNEGSAFVRLSRLVSELENPIACFGGGVSIENARVWALRELLELHSGLESRREYVSREMPLLLSGLSVACHYPTGVMQNFPVLAELSETESFEPLLTLLEEVHSQPELEEAILNVLGDPETPGLVGVLQSLHGRDLLRPALVMLSATPDSTLHVLEEGARVLLRRVETSVGRQTVYEVFGAFIKRLDAERFAEWVATFESVLQDEEWTLSSIALRLRAAFYSTNRHPFVETAKDLLVRSERYKGLIRIAIGFSENEKFWQAFRDLKRLSENGVLAETLRGLVRLFHARAEEGRLPDVVRTEPPELQPVLHKRRVSNFEWIEFENVSAASGWSECRTLPLSVDWSRVRPGDHFFALWKECAAATHWNGVEAILEPLTAAASASGTSLVFEGMQAAHRVQEQLGGAEWASLMRRLVGVLDDKELDATLSLLGTRAASEWGIVFGRILGGWSTIEAETQAALNWVADRLNSDALVSWARHLRFVLRASHPVERTVQERFWESQHRVHSIMPEVEHRECRSIPFVEGHRERAKWVTIRSEQLWYNFALAASNDEIYANRSARRGWSTAELHHCLGKGISGAVDSMDPIAFCKEPLVEALADPAVVRGLMRVLQDFTGDSLYDWLDRRAKDTEVISYYFPGERAPQARVVNSLDLLEIVLLNADIDLSKMVEMPLIGPMLESTFGVKANMALHFLGMIGEAWGDEPRSRWPEPIQQKFQNTKPLTLRQAYNKIREQYEVLMNLMGLPDVHSCEPPSPQGRMRLPNWLVNAMNEEGIPAEEMRSRLFNIGQSLHVIENNLPDADHPQAGGMRVLRKLFYELYYASAPESRKPRALWKNRLSVVVRLVRMGLTRQVGRVLYAAPERDPEYRRFFNSLVDLSKNPELPSLVLAAVPQVDDYEFSLYAALIDELSHGLEQKYKRAWIQELGFDVISILGTLQHSVGVAPVAAFTRSLTALLQGYGDTAALWVPGLLKAVWENPQTVGVLKTFETYLVENSFTEEEWAFLRESLEDPRLIQGLGPWMDQWALYLPWWTTAYEHFTETDEWREFDAIEFLDWSLGAFEPDTVGLRGALASELRRGALPMTFLHFLRRYPERTRALLEELQERTVSGEVRAFLDLTIRSLQNTKDEQR